VGARGTWAILNRGVSHARQDGRASSRGPRSLGGPLSSLIYVQRKLTEATTSPITEATTSPITDEERKGVQTGTPGHGKGERRTKIVRMQRPASPHPDATSRIPASRPASRSLGVRGREQARRGRRSILRSMTWWRAPGEDPGQRAGPKVPDEERKGIESGTAGA